MSDNTGKELRDKNMEQFESDQPESINPFKQDNEPDISSGIMPGFGADIAQENAIGQAGKSFSQDGVFESPFSNDHFNSKMFGFDMGSVTDGQEKEDSSYLSTTNPHIDFDKFRADQQSGFAKAGSLMTQFAAKTGVATVGGIAGGIYGIGEWATKEGADWSSIFDNDFYRGMDDLNEQIELKNSVFVNHKDGIGFNAKMFKGVSDAFSFIAGAVLSELALNTVGNAAGGAGTAMLPARLLRYGDKIGDFIKGGNKFLDTLETADDIKAASRKLGVTVDKLSKMRQQRDIINAVTSGAGNFARRSLTVTNYEAALEARGAKDEMLQAGAAELDYYLETADMSPSEKAEYRENKMIEIEKNADLAGLTTFGFNTAVLGISNAMQFPQIFGNSYIKSANVGNIVRKGLGEVGRKEGAWAVTQRILGTTGRVLKNPATEFMEETLQGVISNSSQNYFEVMMGTKSQRGVLAPRMNGVADSIYKGAVETYGTEEGLTEGVIGAIVGFIGIPGMKKGKRGADGKEGKDRFQMQGGVAESWRNEKERRENTQNAIDTINNSEMSDVLSYNLDNAIRASLDSQREDMASITDNKVAFEGVRDNKVYRYTIDRLEKGMGDTIQEDVAELEQMASNDIEKYRKLFQKDSTFTKADAVQEVKEFKEKSEVYSQAYNKVNKRFNKELMRKDENTKLLIDTLTYAVATEKVQNMRLDKLVDVVSKKLEGKFTPEEIKNYIKNSHLYNKAQGEYDGYVDTKEEEKLNKKLNKKEKLELEEAKKKFRGDNKLFVDAFQLTDQELDSEIEIMTNLPEGSEIKRLFDEGAIDQEYLDNHIAEYKKQKELRSEYNGLEELVKANREEFQAKKSSVARRKKQEVERINKDLSDNMTDAMRSISDARKVDEKGLDNHLAVDKALKAHSQAAPDSVLDSEMEEWESFQDMKREFNEISDTLTTATSVAKHLYGFSKNPMQAYQKVMEGQFYQDLHNLERMQQQIQLMVDNGADENEITGLLSEFIQVLEQVEKDFKKMQLGMALQSGKDYIEKVQEYLDQLNGFRTSMEEMLGIERTRKEDEDNAIKNEEKKQKKKQAAENDQRDKDDADKKKGKKDDNENEEDDFDVPDSERGDGESLLGHLVPHKKKKASSKDDSTNEDNSEDPNATTAKKAKGSPYRRNKRSSDSMLNTLTISDKANFPQGQELAKLMAEGKIKHNAAATLIMQDEKMYDASVNARLATWFINNYDQDTLTSYLDGMNKVKKMAKDQDFEGLDMLPADMDRDVFTFIRFFPAKMMIYDKSLSAKDKYKFDVEDMGDPIFTQEQFFAPDDLQNISDDDNRKRYNEEYEKLEKEREIRKSKLDKKDTVGKSKVDAWFNHAVKNLEQTEYAGFHNSTSNFDYRRRLALATFGEKGQNVLKLKIDRVDQGPLQNYAFNAEPVQEFAMGDLGISGQNITANDLLISGRQGEYKRIDGEPLENLDDNPLPGYEDKQSSVTGKLYYVYKDQTGKKLPIQLNTRKFNQTEVDIMLNHMEKFLEAGKNGKYTFDKSGIPALDEVFESTGMDKNLDNLMRFFMRSWVNGTYDAVFTKNTFSVIKNETENFIQLRLGDTATISIKSLSEFKEKRGALSKHLSNSRFTINKKYITEPKKKEEDEPVMLPRMLQYMFDNKIINHSFDVEKGFDGIYEAGAKKRIFISRNIPVSRTKPKKPTGQVQLLKDLKTKISFKAKDNKNDIQLHHITGKHHGDVVYQYKKNKEKALRGEADRTMEMARTELTAKEQSEIYEFTVNAVMDKSVQLILDIKKERPGILKANDHSVEFKIQNDTDSEFDKTYRLLEATRDKLLNDKKLKKDVIDQSNLTGSKSALVDAFGNSTNIEPINKITKGQFDTNITSEKSFDMVMAHVNFIENNTQGKDQLPVTFAYDSPSFSKRKAFRKEGQIVDIVKDGLPYFDTKTNSIKGGDVYVQIRHKTKDGFKTDYYLMLAGTDVNRGDKKNTIITQMTMPFSNRNLEIDERYVNDLTKDEMTRAKLGKDSRLRLSGAVEAKVGLSGKSKKKIYEDPADSAKKMKELWGSPDQNDGPSAESPIKDVEIEEETGDDMTEKWKDNTLTTVTPTTINKSLYREATMQNSMRLVIQQLQEFESQKFNEGAKAKFTEYIKDKLMITTSSELISIYEMYKDEGLLTEVHQKLEMMGIKVTKDLKINNFAEHLLGKVDCK